MTKEQFIKLAMRTKSEITALSAQKSDVVHALMGMAEEAMEFADALADHNVVNTVEELGDFYWFCALYENASGQAIDAAEPDYQINPSTVVKTLLKAAKKAFAYGDEAAKETTTRFISQALWTMTAITCIVLQKSFDEVEAKCREVVIKKLKARYPEKYSKDLALFRDLENERKTLEIAANETSH